METNNEEKQAHDLDEKIRREKEEIRELKNVLAHEKGELHQLEEGREEEHHNHHPQVLDVNTREIEYPEKEILFREAVKLAFPDAVFDDRFTYTVEYSKGPGQNPKGSLIDNGKKILVKNRMVFDVERADKS
ncbi:MAG: multiubiquitin domain-containing protein [Bacteroidota bacterium]|nr:multiubiquitin domain-containing protein [Bacteroidota bacterium]